MPSRALRRIQSKRFIPTRVGNAVSMRRREAFRSVHPHASGECDTARIAAFLVYGSSPREWGMPSVYRNQTRRQRFIPTRVGNASRHPSMHDRSSVHPHASGECTISCCPARHLNGSSPREWGMLLHGHALTFFERLIPTRVGNALGRQCALGWASVHPHASGEC